MIALVTGFSELLGKVNPSAMIARRVNGSRVSGLEVVGVELPENFYDLPSIARRLIRKFGPAVVISLGWDSIAMVKVEKVALNVMHSLLGGKIVPDHFGNKPMGEEIIRGGPAAYWSTIPAESIVEATTREGIPAAVSYFAGTHCCNTLLYSFLHATRSLRKNAMVGHFHIPPIREMQMKDGPRMKLDKELAAVKQAIATCARQLNKKS